MAHIPGRRAGSVHLEEFPKVDGFADAPLLETWEALLDVRETVNAALEEKRKNKVIGTSLGATAHHQRIGPDRLRCLKSRRDDSADALQSSLTSP